MLQTMVLLRAVVYQKEDNDKKLEPENKEMSKTVISALYFSMKAQN